MNSKYIIFIITLILFFLLSFNYTYSSFKWIETQINSQSNKEKIKKLQLTFTNFNLYNWNIDWNYESIKPILLSYQLDKWIISSVEDSSAWYFWVKTLTALKNDFPENFEQVTSSVLKMDPPDTNKRYFILTAYYSPIPWQKRYSYLLSQKRYRTYSEEIKLQWDWKKTASWKDVYTWVLAAPRNYDFWTKIEFEWIWVWVVEDRWWAIVNSWERKHEYDRIDIWMWYWYEWLLRAEKWWKRKILWKIVSNDTKVNIEFADTNILKYSNLKVDAEKPSRDNVIKLQELFKEINLYYWNIDWNFENIRDILVKFQVDNNIIDSYSHPHAWYFWNKTFLRIKNMYFSNFFIEKDTNLEDDINLTLTQKRELNLVLNKVNNLINKKYWINTTKSLDYRKKLKQLLTIKIQKINNKLTKAKLEYIKNIL